MHSLRHPVRFISIFALVLSAMFLGNSGTAAAANPLLCTDGTTDTANGDTVPYVYGGICTLDASGTVATLDNRVTGPDGSYSGVYYAVSSITGALLSDVSDLSFNYTGVATPGSPRISLGIDTDNDGAYEFFLSIGAFYCNNNAGLVDPMTDTSCTIWSNLDGTNPLGSSWAAVVAAHPDWRVSEDLPFIVADDPGIWTVSNVHLGEAAEDVATDKDECKDGGWEDMTRADSSSFKNQGDCIQYVNTGK